mgnify:CR=1 FL=1
MSPNQVIVLAMPVFLLLIAIEFLVGRKRGRNTYRLSDAVSSIGLGMLSRITDVFTLALRLGIYVWVQDHAALWRNNGFWTSPAGWLLALVCYDFLYYWNHRIGHEVGVFWAAHVVHHQSQHYNLSTALRQPASYALLGWVFYLPMAVLGVPPLPQPAVRLGLRLVGSLHKDAAERLVEARATGPAFANTEDLALRAQLSQQDLQALAAADALAGLSGHRRQQMWEAAAQHTAPPLLRDVPVHEAPLQLLAAPEGEEILFDYAATGLTLRRHPLALLRPRLARWCLQTALQLNTVPHGRKVRACGIVTVRQRPGTAKGVIFLTLEDETGTANVVVWAAIYERFRRAVIAGRLLRVTGRLQREAGVVHVVAEVIEDLSHMLDRLLDPGFRYDGVWAGDQP